LTLLPSWLPEDIPLFSSLPLSCLASIIISSSASPRDPYIHLLGDMETSRNLGMYPPSACVRLTTIPLYVLYNNLILQRNQLFLSINRLHVWVSMVDRNVISYNICFQIPSGNKCDPEYEHMREAVPAVRNKEMDSLKSAHVVL
jgi:hypothetical protein